MLQGRRSRSRRRESRMYTGALDHVQTDCNHPVKDLFTQVPSRVVLTDF